MDLNSREIASLVWIGIALLASLLYAPIRPAMREVWRALTHAKILIVLGLLGLYVAGIVWCLARLGLWQLDQLKNTLIWSAVVGFGSMFRVTRIADDPGFFSKWIMDNLKFIVVVEFLVSVYTFHLAVELVMLPFLTLVFMMLAVNEGSEKHAPVTKFLNGIIVIVGLVILVYTFAMIVADFANFASLATFRDFYTPVLLSLLFVPFIFVMHIIVSYENAFLRLRFLIKDERLRRYMKLRAIFSFGPAVGLLSRWTRNVGLIRPRDKSEVSRSIQEVWAARRRERHPIAVPPEQGWSPDIARKFLTSDGLTPRDYHRQYDEAWYASSPHLNIGDGVLPNHIVYYVEGDELVARSLILTLDVTDPEGADAADQKFFVLVQVLVQKACGNLHVPAADTMDIVTNGRRFTLKKDQWQGGIAGAYEREFKIMIETAAPADIGPAS